MAIINAQTANGFSGLPAIRQLGLMIGLAASVALGVAVVLWSQSPNYTLLYGNLDSKDSSQVLDALQKAGIPFKLEDGTGAILVLAGKVHEARMELSSQGLPKGQGVGFELLDQEQQMGTSQYVQHARFRHAQEIELARSISTMRNVKSARVHLAIPKRTAFIRKQADASASVVLELYTGRSLNEQQVASIVHMVSSSISSLDPDKVTVVDQNGNLFTNGLNNKAMTLASNQFDHTRKLEAIYKARIEELISPIVGPGRVRAQVVAQIDFTRTEKTLEQFSPDSNAVRSEQINEQKSGSGGNAEGVPGALSNQPPDQETQTSGAAGAERLLGTAGATDSSRSSRQTTKNYELNKTISHVVAPGSSLKRLSVAVLVDDLQTIDDQGEIIRTSLDQQALERITILVKDAVGFSEERGDTVNVVNASFYTPAAPEALPEIPVWEQPWVWDVGKQATGALFVLIMLFGVIKPVLRNLSEAGKNVQQAMLPITAEAGAAATGMAAGTGQAALADNSGQMPGLPPPGQNDNQLGTARSLVQEDPARVAQVVKTWVNSDG